MCLCLMTGVNVHNSDVNVKDCCLGCCRALLRFVAISRKLVQNVLACMDLGFNPEISFGLVVTNRIANWQLGQSCLAMSIYVHRLAWISMHWWSQAANVAGVAGGAAKRLLQDSSQGDPRNTLLQVRICPSSMLLVHLVKAPQPNHPPPPGPPCAVADVSCHTHHTILKFAGGRLASAP